jgi:hypothetical protein
MAKHKIIFLFLALACFLGIILIFIFDGYMGVYDGLRIDNGQYVQTVDVQQWQQQQKFGFYPSVSADRGRSVSFTYTVENHRFSAYAADVRVSLWYGVDKVADLPSGQVSAAAFGSGEFALVLDAGQYVPADFPADQNYNLTLVIDREDIERKVMVYINPGSIVVPKPVVPTITIPPPPR